MLNFLKLHYLAAQRGEGLRPELLALFERLAETEAYANANPDADQPNASGRQDDPPTGAEQVSLRLAMPSSPEK